MSTIAAIVTGPAARDISLRRRDHGVLTGSRPRFAGRKSSVGSTSRRCERQGAGYDEEDEQIGTICGLDSQVDPADPL